MLKGSRIRLLGCPFPSLNASPEQFPPLGILAFFALTKSPARPKDVGKARIGESELFDLGGRTPKVVLKQMLQHAGGDGHPCVWASRAAANQSFRHRAARCSGCRLVTPVC